MKATVNSDIYFNNGYIAYAGMIISETEKAFQIEFSQNNGDSNNRTYKSWIPKSVVESKKFDSCNAEYLTIKNWFIKNIFNKKSYEIQN